MATLEITDTLLFGHCAEEGLVAVELDRTKEGCNEVVLFWRRNAKTIRTKELFKPFILVESESRLDGLKTKHEICSLTGAGRLRAMADFDNWNDCLKAKAWLAKETGFTHGAPMAPYLFLNDPVHQYLMRTGRTLFKGMHFEDLRRLQVDIECIVSEGYEFCNAEREGDRIVVIALSDGAGWTEIIGGMDEKAMLERFVAVVKKKDPDVIEGHNVFNFDLPYLRKRARLKKVKLNLGRDGSLIRARSSRFNAAERTISYERHEVFGRHVVDTLFLAQSYDVSHRSLTGLGLKEVAIHFGLARKGRVYIDGSDIAKTYKKDPEKLLEYAEDDVLETAGLSAILSQSYFIQAQMLPYSYQNICVRGNATKIDSMMIRKYLFEKRAIPSPGIPREFAGGYTDMLYQGVAENVHHCDVRSLYPSLMLTKGLGPRKDELGIFLKLLDSLKSFRLDARQKMADSVTDAERTHYNALQSTFKVLINSFYGYLGARHSRFCDFAVAEEITANGRKLLKAMLRWLEEHGAQPIEMDTDGIYFVPPEFGTRKAENDRRKGGKVRRRLVSGRERPAESEELEKFREEFAASLPEGIDVEFDGEYVAMFSYKMKNYALLDRNGEMIIKGAALKSRGLEPFQREFLKEMLRLILEKKNAGITALRDLFEKAIRRQEWPIQKLAKTETLQDSPASYAVKVSRKKRGRNAAYELALASGREYRAGDQLTYYVTGEKKSVALYEAAKLISDWNPKKRDENIAYYVAKLDALYRKFNDDQGDLFADLKSS